MPAPARAREQRRYMQCPPRIVTSDLLVGRSPLCARALTRQGDGSATRGHQPHPPRERRAALRMVSRMPLAGSFLFALCVSLGEAFVPQPAMAALLSARPTRCFGAHAVSQGTTPPPLPDTNDPFVLLGIDRSYARDSMLICPRQLELMNTAPRTNSLISVQIGSFSVQ